MNDFFYRSILLVFVVLTAALSGYAQSGRSKPTPTPTPDDTVRITTEEVKINVIAFDEEEKFVTNVTTEDLVITDNNVLHRPESLRRIPANVLIVMDTGGELRSVKTLNQTRRTATALINSLRPEDAIAILQYGDTTEFVATLTTDRQTIFEAVKSTKFGRRSVFSKALQEAVEYFDSMQIENKHIVLITDGTDSLADSTAKYNALRKLMMTDINVHVISYTRMEATDIEPRTSAISNAPAPKAMPDEIAAQLPPGVRDRAQAPKIGPTINVDRKHLATMRQRKADLEKSEVDLIALAESTNGTIIIPETLDEMVDRAVLVAKMIDSSYVLTYIPKIALDEGTAVRNIEVTSKRDGLIVHARRRLVIDRQ